MSVENSYVVPSGDDGSQRNEFFDLVDQLTATFDSWTALIAGYRETAMALETFTEWLTKPGRDNTSSCVLTSVLVRGDETQFEVPLTTLALESPDLAHQLLALACQSSLAMAMHKMKRLKEQFDNVEKCLHRAVTGVEPEQAAG